MSPPSRGTTASRLAVSGWRSGWAPASAPGLPVGPPTGSAARPLFWRWRRSGSPQPHWYGRSCRKPARAEAPRPAGGVASDDAVSTQGSDCFVIEAEPVGQHFGGVLAEQGRRFDFGRDAVEAHRPGRHRHLPLAMRHRLQDAALPEARLAGQIHRIEDGAGGDADRAQLRPGFVLPALPRPTFDELVDLGLALQTGLEGIVTRIADH